MLSRTLLLIFLVLTTSTFSSRVFADEETLNQQAGSSAAELPSSFAPVIEQSEHALVNNIEHFFTESKLNLRLRNYYIDEKESENSDDSTWAQGGSLKWVTGKYKNTFSIDSELFYSAKLYLPDNSDGGGLLSEDGSSYQILGVLNPQFDFAGQKLSLYRQKINFAYVNQHDSRMTPNTFEAYLLRNSSNPENPEKLEYVAGYINKIRKRNSDSFIYMSDVAGSNSSENGTVVTGARYHFTPDITYGAINYFTDSALNILYSEAEFKRKLSKDWGMKLGLQYSRQDTIGDDLTGSNYSTGFWGAQSAFSYQAATLRLAYNRNSDDANLLSPYGSYPSYTSLIVEDFNLANEETIMSGISLDLSELGAKNLSFSAYHASSSNTDKDKKENDFGLDYRFTEGTFKNLTFRLRAAIINNEQTAQQEEYRAIINYDFNIYSGVSS